MEANTRFWAKVDKSGECWIWRAATIRGGYGQFRDGDSLVVAHRWAYEASGRQIADGLQLDHLCRNRACVNPEHLEAVTCRQNLLRGQTRAAANASKTHCPQGHPYTPENTYMFRNLRACRACRSDRGRLAYQRKLLTA